MSTAHATSNATAPARNPPLQRLDEELAGPAAPTASLQRISHLDIVRGIGVMGILVSNIQNFSGCSIISADIVEANLQRSAWEPELLSVRRSADVFQ
jgi:hypothetical protein